MDLTAPGHHSLLNDLDAACPVINTAIYRSFKAGDVPHGVQCTDPPSASATRCVARTILGRGHGESLDRDG